METVFDRLMRAAEQLHKKTRPSEVARLIDETEQTISNWRRRGVPKAKILDIAADLRCSPQWLASGLGNPQGDTHLLRTTQKAREPGPTPYIHPNETIAQIVAMLEETDDVGRGIGLMAISQALERYRPKKETAA